MKLTLDANTRVNLIRSYSPREIRVADQLFQRSCIITADTVLADWRPTRIEDLEERDLEPLFALKPDVVLLGTGTQQRFPPAAIRAAFAQRRVPVEAMDLGAACRTFNILVQEERRVCAALLLQTQEG